MAGQVDVVSGERDMGGTMRLGLYPARLAEGSLVRETYGNGYVEGAGDLGGTMRLGLYPAELASGSIVREAYGDARIEERHRHRYEVNNDYREALTSKGMVISGLSPDRRLVEMIELPNHPYFVGCQFHPEFKSRPMSPHPLFRRFVRAMIEHQAVARRDRAEATRVPSPPPAVRN